MYNIKHYFLVMRISFLYIVVAVLFYGCTSDPMKVDVTEVIVPELTINRMEEDVFNMDTIHINDEVKKLRSKYGKFFNSYIIGILNNGGMPDSSKTNMLKRFISDRDMREAYTDCKKQYADIDFLKQDFTDCFKYHKHYFPKKNLPKVVTMMSGFNYSVVTLDSTIAIGLEMYLGADNKFYNALGLPFYKKKNMHLFSVMKSTA